MLSIVIKIFSSKGVVFPDFKLQTYSTFLTVIPFMLKPETLPSASVINLRSASSSLTKKSTLDVKYAVTQKPG